MKYEIFPLSLDDEKEWEQFVANNYRDATIFHTVKWKKVLEETYNYKPEYLVVKNSEGRIVGIMKIIPPRKSSGYIYWDVFAHTPFSMENQGYPRMAGCGI